MDPSYEHDLAYALRASMEEERARQEESSTAVAEQEGATATSNLAAAIGVGGGDRAAVAAAGVEESKAGDSSDAGVTVDHDAVQARQVLSGPGSCLAGVCLFVCVLPTVSCVVCCFVDRLAEQQQ